MSTAEVIEKIRDLSPVELQEVRNFLQSGVSNGSQAPEINYATDEQFDAAAGRVFEKHDELLRKLAQ